MERPRHPNLSAQVGLAAVLVVLNLLYAAFVFSIGYDWSHMGARTGATALAIVTIVVMLFNIFIGTMIVSLHTVYVVNVPQSPATAVEQSTMPASAESDKAQRLIYGAAAALAIGLLVSWVRSRRS